MTEITIFNVFLQQLSANCKQRCSPLRAYGVQPGYGVAFKMAAFIVDSWAHLKSDKFRTFTLPFWISEREKVFFFLKFL